MSTSERFGMGVAVVDETEDRNEESDNTRLVLYASALRRPDDLLETVLARMRAYNGIVAEVISEAQSTSARIMKYVGDGVLMSFAPDDVAEALRCAGRIAEQLALLPEPPGGGEIKSRMGLSAGEVLDVNYLTGAVESVPGDFVGKPIEIATRLVSDVAKPRQILLDRAARAHVEERHLAALDSSMPEAELQPVKGQSLMIQGMTRSVPVFELVWKGQEERKIHNRQLLQRELTEIRQATLRLLFVIQEKQPIFTDDLRAAHRNIRALLEQLDLRRPSSELFCLKKSVERSLEAPNVVPGLLGYMKTTEDNFVQLGKIWEERGDAVRLKNDKAIEDVLDAYEELLFAVKTLDMEVELKLSPVEEMA